MIKTTTLSLAGVAFVAVLAACGGGGSSGGGTVPTNPPTASVPPSGNPAPSPTATVAATATPTTAPAAAVIGFALPNGAIGTIMTPFGLIGGYTEKTYSQVIAFPPGTVVTLKNLSNNTQHTLNVLSMSSFPASPALSFTASGGNQLGSTYASGPINPGATVQITLSNPGTYYIGCAFHYMNNPSMRGVIEVAANATPGPQATPQPGATGAPGPGGGY